jgi:predicted transcriptional regulator
MQCPPEIEDLLETLYNLTSQEAEILTFICGEDRTVEDLCEELDRERSTVQRYVSSLRKAGLVSRRSVTTEEGKGRYFVYTVKDKATLKQKIRERLDDWAETKRQRLEEF